MFDKMKVPMLKAFYCCRVQEDLKDKTNITNKVFFTKACAGQIDRKTNGTLLIQLRFDVKPLPVCAKSPQLPQPESGIISVPPPTILSFQSIGITQNLDDYTIQWFCNITNVLHGIDIDLTDKYLTDARLNWDEMNLYIDMLSKKLVYRLYGFLKLRITLQRSDLMPGRHCVWDSFKSKVIFFASIMILSGHIIQTEDLRFRKDDENILNTLNHFLNVNILDKSDDIDGYYVVVDTKRSIVIRSGAAASGMA